MRIASFMSGIFLEFSESLQTWMTGKNGLSCTEKSKVMAVVSAPGQLVQVGDSSCVCVMFSHPQGRSPAGKHHTVVILEAQGGRTQRTQSIPSNDYQQQKCG